MSISVKHFEIPVSDLDRAVGFYEYIFGIELERQNMDGYEMALFPNTSDGMGASGALAKGDVYVPGKIGPILYFSVESIDRILERLEGIGGIVLYPKKAIEENGFVSEIEDSEGNRIALHQAKSMSSLPPNE